MGLIGALVGNPAAVQAVGAAASEVAEVFTENRTRKMEKGHDAWMAAMAEHGAEFAVPRQGWFDGVVNGLNRLPRPLLALGTIGLFVYAMADPPGFTERMVGLSAVPEPLWWLLGAIVGFYFGAREAFYFRSRQERGLPIAVARPVDDSAPGPAGGAVAAPAAGDNPALAEWQASRKG